jgi:TRAP-type mannitol/chloroaromatic compound transport system substrate-binding protein
MDDELGMNVLGRRRLLGVAGAAGALLAGGPLLAACSGDDDDSDAAPGTTDDDGASTGGGDGEGDGSTAVDLIQEDLPQVDWEMTTSWPAGLATLFGTEENGVGAVGFAQLVGELSGGRFTIEAKQADELAGALEVIDVLQSGAIPAGHTASYYYHGKSPAFAFGTAVPFGLTFRQQFSWLYYHRDDEGRTGLDMLRDFYACEYNVINFPAGNTGCQMGGFFNREINSLDDLQGIVMRIPGLGGEIMTRLGVTTQNLPGGEIAQALQTGAIDAAEFVGPYDDNTLGLGEAGNFYYYPGWWEPGATLDVFVSLDAYNELPDEYKGILEIAAQLSYLRMMGYYDSIQPFALQEIEADGAELRPFPDDVMEAAKAEAETLLDELAASDQNFATILEHWRPYRDAVQPWHATAELSTLQAGAPG